jgi:hypothetical protein
MFIKKNSLISFFSSGFSSHVRVKAIDLSSPDMKTFYSPFEGKIVKVEKFVVGRPNKYATEPYDYLILLESNGKLIKILHVEPIKGEGERVCKGETLGYFVNSPYTGGDFLHAHIEGISIRFPRIKDYRESKVGRVVKIAENYFDVEIVDYATAGGFNGVGCCGGLLNTSYPYACYGGIIGGWDGKLEFMGIKLGVPYKVRRKNLVMFEGKKGLIRGWETNSSFKVLENKPVCGSKPFFESVLSYKGYPRIRFFRKYNGKIGDIVELGRIIRDYLGREV